VRVAGRGYRDGVRSLEVMLESLSGGRRQEIQEDGIVMEVKNLNDAYTSGFTQTEFVNYFRPQRDQWLGWNVNRGWGSAGRERRCPYPIPSSADCGTYTSVMSSWQGPPPSPGRHLEISHRIFRI